MGIVGTVVSLFLLGVAVIAGLTFYYSPRFCWKGKDSLGPLGLFQAFRKGVGVGGGRRPLLCSPTLVQFFRLLPWVQMCNKEAPKHHSRTPCHLSRWVIFLIVHSFVTVRWMKSFREVEVDVMLIVFLTFSLL